jgi:hypothetical protein
MEAVNNNADGHHQPHQGHLVTITVDGTERHIHAGTYRVGHLKTLLGVPAEYELDRVVHGEFQPLSDDAEIDIRAGLVFVSHVRCGGSS